MLHCFVPQMILFPLLWVLIVPPAIMGGYVPPGPRFRCPKESKYVYPCVCVRGSDRGLYVRCENTNLASLSLAFSNLGNEGIPIEELVLYKCNIGKLARCFSEKRVYTLRIRGTSTTYRATLLIAFVMSRLKDVFMGPLSILWTFEC